MLEHSVVDDAQRAASRAAATAGVDVRELHGMADCVAVAGLFRQVWLRAPDNPPISADVMRALAHSGNYLAGAFVGDELVGAAAGFLAAPVGKGLHSHITGVAAAARGRSVGFALKLHQRAWALRRDLDSITWTFDPLVRRNAYFNLAKLAARSVAYLKDFYGRMDDGINGAGPSDRLVLSWPIAERVVELACAGQRLDVSDQAAGAAVALDQRDGLPLVRQPSKAEPSGLVDPGGLNGPARGETVLVRVPADIEGLRGQDPAAADAWRMALREVLGGLLDAGATITGFIPDGAYVVSTRQ
jgi:predicted GNAT superfamily acetyltransferase